MVYVDANYFIRLILRDIPSHYDSAYKLISSGVHGEVKLVTSMVVFFEVYWVLSSFYRISKVNLSAALKMILEMNFINLSEREILKKALILFEKTNLGLEDCYHLCWAKDFGADSLATFDKKLKAKFKTLG